MTLRTKPYADEQDAAIVDAAERIVNRALGSGRCLCVCYGARSRLSRGVLALPRAALTAAETQISKFFTNLGFAEFRGVNSAAT